MGPSPSAKGTTTKSAPRAGHGDDMSAALAAAIESLESEAGKSGEKPDAEEMSRRQTQLRMLYLLAGRRDDSLQ